MEQQMQYPSFVKLKALSALSKDSKECVEYKIRINPIYISSYEENGDWLLNGENVKAVGFNCGSRYYMVNMSLEEFDSMIEEIDRGLNFKIDDE